MWSSVSVCDELQLSLSSQASESRVVGESKTGFSLVAGDDDDQLQTAAVPSQITKSAVRTHTDGNADGPKIPRATRRIPTLLLARPLTSGLSGAASTLPSAAAPPGRPGECRKCCEAAWARCHCETSTRGQSGSRRSERKTRTRLFPGARIPFGSMASLRASWKRSWIWLFPPYVAATWSMRKLCVRYSQ